jgi:hypothetical protein
MNDTELSTAVRDSVAGIRAATPVEAIISRGRGVRARRRIPVAAGALTVAAGAALAVTTLVPAGHSGLVPSSRPGLASTGTPGGSHSNRVQLAAWTVAKRANGDIDVTINQLKDPAGLQATLRADGLPVSVSFSGPLVGASCRQYTASRGTLRTVAQFHGDSVAIDPSALPSGTGVAIFDEPGTGLPLHPSPAVAPRGAPPLHPSAGSVLSELAGPLAIGLVYASPQCTG